MLSLFARMIDRAKKIRTNEKFGEGEIRKEGENAPSYLSRAIKKLIEFKLPDALFVF